MPKTKKQETKKIKEKETKKVVKKVSEAKKPNNVKGKVLVKKEKKAKKIKEDVIAPLANPVEEKTVKTPKKKSKVYEGLGRRKRSVARVWLYEDKGDITINGKDINSFFVSEKSRVTWQKPFHVVGISHPSAKFMGTIKVSGGGNTGQVGAVLLGVARALVKYNEDFRSKLRQAGFLTRDPREVESKKVFLKKARKSPQYSKR